MSNQHDGDVCHTQPDKWFHTHQIRKCFVKAWFRFLCGGKGVGGGGGGGGGGVIGVNVDVGVAVAVAVGRR